LSGSRCPATGGRPWAQGQPMPSSLPAGGQILRSRGRAGRRACLSGGAEPARRGVLRAVCAARRRRPCAGHGHGAAGVGAGRGGRAGVRGWLPAVRPRAFARRYRGVTLAAQGGLHVAFRAVQPHHTAVMVMHGMRMTDDAHAHALTPHATAVHVGAAAAAVSIGPDGVRLADLHPQQGPAAPPGAPLVRLDAWLDSSPVGWGRSSRGTVVPGRPAASTRTQGRSVSAARGYAMC
jgi:hypothetical protein